MASTDRCAMSCKGTSGCRPTNYARNSPSTSNDSTCDPKDTE
ncbi:hypothetical protein [Mycolicibacterium tusciae]